MENKILSEIPKKYGIGKNNNKLVDDFIGMVGKNFNISYNNKLYDIYVKEYLDLERGKKFNISFNSQTYIIGCKSFINCNFSRIVIKGINDIATTHPHLIKYFANREDAYKYSKGSCKAINCKCPNCGLQKEMSINHLINKEFSCLMCGDGVSFPNKTMYNLLYQLEIDFETEKLFDWCKYKFKNKFKQGKYDFYFKLNNKEYILEMDGGFHTNNNKMSGQTKEESKFIDDEKDRLALEHGIDVIRIDCNYEGKNRFSYIKQNILNNKNLNKLFDIRKVDWYEVEKYCNNNINKILSDYWNNNDTSITKMTYHFKFSNSFIYNALSTWSKLGLCTYNGKEEKLKSNKIIGKSNGKKVEMFKDNISIGIFENCHELERQSEELFGVKLDFSKISSVCRGNKLQYKGYTFKYVQEKEAC